MTRKLFLCTTVCLFLSNTTFANDADLCDSNLKSKSYTEAFRYCEKACNLDNGLGCSGLGFLYDNGNGVRQDYQQAKTYYEKACNLDEGLACNVLGANYSLKCFAIKNPAFAECCIEDKDRQIIQSIPDFKNEASCFRKSKEYYGKACDLGEQKGCDGYRELNEQGY